MSREQVSLSIRDVILSSVGTATFILNLLVTVLLLILTVHSGRRGLRKRHYFLVFATLLSLILAIRQAGIYGKSFEFNPLRLSIHLGFAFSALASFLGVAASGVLLIKSDADKIAKQIEICLDDEIWREHAKIRAKDYASEKFSISGMINNLDLIYWTRMSEDHLKWNKEVGLKQKILSIIGVE